MSAHSSVPAPDAPFTSEELAEAEALQGALDAKRTDSEDALLLHELRALHTDEDLSEAEHEAMIAAALGHVEVGDAEPAKPVLRLLRRVSYAVVPTLAAAATVMFVIRGREARAPASATSETMAAPTATIAAAPAVESKASSALEGYVAKQEERKKAEGALLGGGPEPPNPWKKLAEESNYAKPPPPERIGDSVPGGGALGTGLGYGAGSGGGAAGAAAGSLAGKAYGEAPRARAGAAASKGAAADDESRYDFKDDALGASAAGPAYRRAAGDKTTEAQSAHAAPTVPPVQAAQTAAAPMAEADNRAHAAPAASAPLRRDESRPQSSAKRAAPAKPARARSCQERCTELLEARKRLDASCMQPSANANVCADQRTWLASQLTQHVQACGSCK